jgi:hypothetical protein
MVDLLDIVVQVGRVGQQEKLVYADFMEKLGRLVRIIMVILEIMGQPD